jgi:hypothetical protein
LSCAAGAVQDRGQVDDYGDEPVVAAATAGVRPAVLVDADDSHPIQTGRVGGHDLLVASKAMVLTVSQDNPSSLATAATVMRSIMSRRRM